MKVAIATDFPIDPRSPKGGVQAVSVNLADGLLRLDGIELHVVTIGAKGEAASTTSWQGATIHRLARPGGSMLKIATGPGRRLISDFLTELNPDVVHAHDTFGLMVKGLAIPRVFTIHGFIYGDTALSGRKLSWLRAQVWRIVETSGWKNQPHIISISPYVRERLSGIVSSVIHDIDNPISQEHFEILKDEVKGNIFSAAAICPRKNTLALVEAFAKLVMEHGVDARLRLAGHITHEGYGVALRERISQLGLKDRVTLLGRIGSDAVGKELAAASVFALVSLEENSPMGIEEAMAVGVPVVTSNRCGMPYMVRHGETGYLVDPMNSAQIARRLKALIMNDHLRERLGEESRSVATSRFHPACVARRTRDVYVEAIESSLPPHIK